MEMERDTRRGENEGREGPRRPRGQAPVCLAIILCDAVIEDKATNKKSLFGLFNTIGAAKFPVVHPAASLLVTLTDGRGRTPLAVRLANLESDKELLRMQGEVQFENPNSVVDLVLHIQGLPIPEPGTYVIEVLFEGAIVGSRRFQAIETKAQ